MPRVDSVRDLGVKVSSDLTFREHITTICKKAYRNLGFVLRQTKDLQNILAVKSLYNALVRSHLECCSLVWHPYEQKYNIMIERLQNKFLRHMYAKQYGVYPGYPIIYPTLFLLGTIGYHKLEVRRKLALATYVFKVFRGQLNNSLVLEAIGLRVPNSRLRQGPRQQVFVVPKCRTNILKHSPMTSAIRILNGVSREVDLFYCSLMEFTKVTLNFLCKTED